MGWDREVVERLGADCVKVILDAVTSGSIDIQAIHHIAARLDSGDERIVSGKSLHRTKSVDSCKPDQEMRQVLNDWYNQELYGLEWCDALDKLIKIFESDVVNLRPVAKDLKVIRTKKIQGSKANQTSPTSDAPESSAGESALRSNSHSGASPSEAAMGQDQEKSQDTNPILVAEQESISHHNTTQQLSLPELTQSSFSPQLQEPLLHPGSAINQSEEDTHPETNTSTLEEAAIPKEPNKEMCPPLASNSTIGTISPEPSQIPLSGSKDDLASPEEGDNGHRAPLAEEEETETLTHQIEPPKPEETSNPEPVSYEETKRTKETKRQVTRSGTVKTVKTKTTEETSKHLKGQFLVFGFWLVSMVFQGGFMVFGWFPWFFKVVSWFLVGFHGFVG